MGIQREDLRRLHVELLPIVGIILCLIFRRNHQATGARARVSTDDQDTAAQVKALKAAECERIYREKASGGRRDRPELHRLLDQLRKGDVLVLWKILPVSLRCKNPLYVGNQKLRG